MTLIGSMAFFITIRMTNESFVPKDYPSPDGQ
jgi:hypothetical protein